MSSARRLSPSRLRQLASRPSPPESATEFEEGDEMEGNDGRMWVVEVNSAGVKRWAPVRDRYGEDEEDLSPRRRSPRRRASPVRRRSPSPRPRHKTPTRADRPSPAVSATWHKKGKELEGGDGRMWRVNVTDSGIHRWVLVRDG